MRAVEDLQRVVSPPRWRVLAAATVVACVLAGCVADTEPATTPGAGPDTTVGLGGTTAPSTPRTSAEPLVSLFDAACAGTLQITTTGKVDTAAGSELSGIVASRANPGVYWVHDDSGAGPEVHAIAGDGSLLGTFALDADAIDWEDIAIGPAPGGLGWALVLADIGDNLEARADVILYRVGEPPVDIGGSGAAAPAAPTIADVDTVTFTYPDRPHNAEALLIDPDTGQVVIVTKETDGVAQVFVADGDSMVDGATVVLAHAGSISFGGGGLGSWVTGADVAPDGSVIAVRTYGGVHLFARTPGTSIADALATPPCDGPPPVEVQGEAVTIDVDGRSYVTVSEGDEPLLHRTT